MVSIDSWPDPSGPRDIRLHRRYRNGKEEAPKAKLDWGVPFLEYVRTNNYPGWMRTIGKFDMALRKEVLKLPMSHLFYVLGKK